MNKTESLPSALMAQSQGRETFSAKSQIRDIVALQTDPTVSVTTTERRSRTHEAHPREGCNGPVHGSSQLCSGAESCFLSFHVCPGERTGGILVPVPNRGPWDHPAVAENRDISPDITSGKMPPQSASISH